VAYCLHTLATIAHYVEQNPVKAIGYYGECAAIYSQAGEKYYLAQTLSKLGEAYQLIGKTELTVRYVNEAYQLQREIGDQMGESETLRALGMTAFQIGDYDGMGDFIQKAFAIQLNTNYVVGQATSNLYIGYIAFTSGDTVQGRELVTRGLAQALEVADHSTQAWCYAILGWIDCAAGDYASAEQNISKAGAIETDPFRQTGAGNPFLEMQINLARFLLEAGTGNFKVARGRLLQPLNLAITTSSQPYMTFLTAMSAISYASEERLESAVELLGLALKQPIKVTGWMKQWQLLNRVRTELQDELGQAAFEAAWKRGQSLDLEEVTKEVMQEIAASPPSLPKS